MKFLKSILVSWDTLAAIIVSVLTIGLTSQSVSNSLVRDLSGVGISVLSIVFAVYFAALATIISSSDDDFVRFLEEDGHYTAIVDTFKWTLASLFVALAISIFLYANTAILIENKADAQVKWFFVVFVFLFVYSLTAAFLATLDAITYAGFRAKFLGERK